MQIATMQRRASVDSGGYVLCARSGCVILFGLREPSRSPGQWPRDSCTSTVP